MLPGYVLVKEQLFFRKELIERLPWLIRLRWAVVVFGFAGCGAVYFFRQWLPLPLMVLLSGVLCYNLLFLLIWRRLSPFKSQGMHSGSDSSFIHAQDIIRFNVFAHAQILFDLFALCLAIWYSGGICSPLALFVIFQIILTGILLSPVSCYLYGVLVSLALGVLVWLQQGALLPIFPLWFYDLVLPHNGRPGEIIVRYATLVAAVLITAFLVTTLKLSLRTKGRELLRLSKALDAGNIKLTALYEMVKEMGMCTASKTLMDSATRLAASIMGVKACSIKLLDAQRKKLRFTSTYGLSEDYVQSKESIDVEKSPINRKIIDGAVYAIGHIEEQDYFAYPEDIRKEGIASLICLPLRVEKRIFGVFCVYSDAASSFTESDVQFFMLMADLTALEIEKLNTEINRIWFLQKAAHQLRSPLHAVVSMLKILQKGYLGAMNVKQEDTVRRCEKRLELLDSLVKDILSLSIRRTAPIPDALHRIQVPEILRALSGLFESQARERNIDITFLIDENLPAVMATNRLLDELLTNLISNALKYTPPEGTVSVCLIRSEEGSIRLEVTDTGIGIPEQDFSRLFTEFFRAENARDFTETGTGLGLVIVKEILDQLKGTISVSSCVGEGSTFVCHLPAM
ncbi:MAG: GAF domain-containing sensor histidine kinase [Pseudomonadota bacterium]